MYQPIVRLFSCDFRVISIRHLPAALPIKRWLSLLNHVTYAHNSGIRETYVLEICPFHTLFSINGLLFLHFCKWRMGSESYMPYGFPSLSPLTDCYFYTSTNGEWVVNRICFMAFLHCLLWRIVTSTLLQMENGHVTVYALWFSFIVSINGLSLLHFCKWRMGSESYMPYGFPSLSPLTDCYFYTSTNGEWVVNRICFMAFLHCLLWRIVTSTLLQMENGHVTVYALWFSFIVSINGLSLLHFCKWRTCM